jgi:hypothetical protein
MNRRFFLLSGSIGLFAASACNVSAQDAVAADVPLDLSGPRPTAQLVIGNAAPVTAIFDSAAAASVLRVSYAERIGAPNEGEAAAHGPNGAPVSGFRTTIAHAKLGQAEFANALAVALDIPLPLEGVDAIISPAVFAGRLVRFDFAASVAHILPITRESTPRSPAEPYIGKNTHGMIHRTPGVTLHLPGGVDASATVDTGARSGLALPLALARRIPLSEPLAPDEPMRLVGAEWPTQKARINGVVRVGGLVLQNPEARFADGAPFGIVGMPVLRNSVVVLDPGGQRSWLLAPLAH